LALAALPSDPPQTDGGYTQDSGKSDQPRGKICDGIASCLFPKPVIFIFLCGAFIGFLIVAGAVLNWQNNEKPK
jgi:hypothetical protein